MTTGNKGGFSSMLEEIEYSSNRSHVVRPESDDEFSVAFREIRHVQASEITAGSFSDRIHYCVVDFLIKRGEQHIVFPVYIEKESVDPMDYMREAAHLLHLDLAKLAEQTAKLKLRGHDNTGE